MKEILKIHAKDIDLIVYDFDGIHTNNMVLVLEDGTEAVFCNRSDGLAVRKIKEFGVKQIILSTETNKVVAARAKKLNIDVIHGVYDKKQVLADYCKDNDISLGKVVYLGNDVNDLEVMKTVGYPLAPQDAYESIKGIAKSIIKKCGGDGVVREFYDNILDFEKE